MAFHAAEFWLCRLREITKPVFNQQKFFKLNDYFRICVNLMLGADSGTSHVSESLDRKLISASIKTDNKNANSLLHRLKNKFAQAYKNDAGVIISTGLGGMATVVYGFWGTDFAMLSAENGTGVAVPLIIRTVYDVNAWMAFNTALNIFGTAAAGEGAKRLGKVVAERDFHKHQNKTLEERLASSNEISKQELQECLEKATETFSAEQLKRYEANKTSYWGRIKPNLTKIGLATYAVAQGGIVATFLLVNNNYNIDGGLVWNDLLIGAASGIIMFAVGKYYEGKEAFYRLLGKLERPRRDSNPRPLT